MAQPIPRLEYVEEREEIYFRFPPNLAAGLTKTAERKIVPTPPSPFFALSTQDDNGDCFRIVIMRQTEAGISVFILGAAATEAKKVLIHLPCTGEEEEEWKGVG